MPSRSPIRPFEAFHRACAAASFVPRRLTASKRALPTFLLIGAQKAGTTSLYDELSQHPDIEPASRKEIQYFTINADRSLNWYRAHFPHDSHGLITGEASPYYLFHPQVPAAVGTLLPDVKLIVMLRNPIDRAWSHYHHARKLGFESLDFEAAIDAEPARLAADEALIANGKTRRAVHHREHSYLARGCYAEQLERWFNVLPREQFLIVRSEAYFRDGASVFNQVLEFLGARSWTPPARAWGKRGGYNESMSVVMRQRLGAFFAHHNARLSRLLDEPCDWLV